jgi:signal peptidase II
MRRKCSMARRIFSRPLVVLTLFLLVGCDHASKGVAKAELETGGARELIRGMLSLRYVENTDVAFNALRSVPEAIRFPLLVGTGAAAVTALTYLLLFTREKVNVPRFALLLVTAGAIGNYLDRLFRGYVVDFVHLKHWPVFNVADVYISLGYTVLAWALFVKRRDGVGLDRPSA